MKLLTILLSIGCCALAISAEAQLLSSSPRPADFVDLAEAAPGIVVKLAYATEQNVFHHQFYKENRCFLRRATAEKLRAVQAELQKEGLGLEILDGYRPLSVQEEFWKAKPDSRYVARPGAQGSRHNRGAAVDVTLVDAHGKELPMPTPFDDFTEKAGAEAADLPAEALANREKLQRAMTHHGFLILQSEWWHFDDSDWRAFPVMNLPITELAASAAKGSPGALEATAGIQPATPHPPPTKVVVPVPKAPLPEMDERVRKLEQRVEALERRLQTLENPSTK